MPRRATSAKRTAEAATELDMQEKEATPVEEIEILLPTEETDKTTESVNANSLMECMREAFQQMEKNNEELNKKIEKNNETLKQQIKEDNRTLKRNTESVSYTHLDVYKRQM